MAIPALPSLAATFPARGDVIGAAHHGTYTARAQNIVRHGFELPPTINPGHRMGKGVYFWEGSVRAGMRWANLHYSDQPHCVLEAQVSLGRHMNLSNSEHQEAFRLIANLLIDQDGSDKVFEGQIFNFFVRKGWIESARRVHHWGEQEYLVPDIEKPWSMGPSDTILCVYVTTLIKAPCIVWQSS